MEPETSTALDELYKSIQTFGSLTMAAENRDKLYQYNDALMRSLCSILEDCNCDETVKMQYFNTTMEQYADAMRELFPKLIGEEITKADEEEPQETPVGKSDTERYDVIVEVEKFNPYHDGHGRFASANSHTSFTFRTKDPNKQHWADMAVAREKDRASGGGTAAAKPKKPKSYDPDAIAGVKRGEPMTREQADEGKANPNFSKGGGYYINCQSCVVTYEARLRGYDVQTLPNTRGSKLSELSRKSNHAWIDPKTGQAPQPKTNSNVTTAKKCREWLESEMEPGARYTFGHSWKGRGRSGHIISADKDADGSVRLFDPQSGKTMKGSEVDSYLNRVKYTATVYGMKVSCSPRLLRIDNMAINPEYADHIMEATAK